MKSALIALRRRLDDFDNHLKSLYVMKHPCQCFDEKEFIDVVIEEATSELLDMGTDGEFIKTIKDYISTQKRNKLSDYWRNECWETQVFTEGDFDKFKKVGFSKFLHGDKFKKIYPMLDKIDAYEVPNLGVILKIYLNDSEITEKNMYQKGFDPHYLLDFHIKKYLPYFGLSFKSLFGFVVVGYNGKTIYQWLN